ncbi:winged helix-turn-helix domain-containing protein [Mycoplasma marinum]|uniref:HTH gntR-type domain-containing protein n=1 Tax=Mycoplasma marinum TaxID=1937190 RepID=A0A4R0XW52_9MOLU|nr:winged helix-turn-helix domain-containing protein [Mycoplasma marinum]TCG11191.1 hypothetical protein C4B24_02815 [Mycoplasma marinum]
MKKYTTKEITQILAKEITMGKYKRNSKLPSEAQLSIKYGISRAITNKVFANLKEMDLVYSIAHQGYFVAEWFSGITTPYHFKYNIDNVEIEEIEGDIKLKDFILSRDLIIKGKTFKKEMYSDGKKIIVSQILCSKSLTRMQNFSIEDSTTDFMNLSKILSSITKFVQFEKDDCFGEKMQLIEYKIYYGKEDIYAISRNAISHKFYKQSKKEKPF